MTDVNLKIPNVIQMIVKDIQSNAAGLADADSFGEAKVRTDRIVALCKLLDEMWERYETTCIELDEIESGDIPVRLAKDRSEEQTKSDRA